MTSLPELSLEVVHRRGHGAMYDALACERIEFTRLRMSLAGLDLPRDASGRLRFAVDVTVWPRPDAECSPGRSHCHEYCRCNGTRQSISGDRYSGFYLSNGVWTQGSAGWVRTPDQWTAASSAEWFVLIRSIRNGARVGVGSERDAGDSVTVAH